MIALVVSMMTMVCYASMAAQITGNIDKEVRYIIATGCTLAGVCAAGKFAFKRDWIKGIVSLVGGVGLAWFITNPSMMTDLVNSFMNAIK